MQGKLLNNCCELVLNAQALLRIPRLDLSSPARLGHKIQFSSTWALNSSALMMEVSGFVTWKRREKGGRSKALSHAMPLPSYVIFQRAQTIILWSGLPLQGWVFTLHRIKSSQPPPKSQHWGETGLKIPVLKLQRMSHENSARHNPWDDLYEDKL